MIALTDNGTYAMDSTLHVLDAGALIVVLSALQFFMWCFYIARRELGGAQRELQTKRQADQDLQESRNMVRRCMDDIETANDRCSTLEDDLRDLRNANDTFRQQLAEAKGRAALVEDVKKELKAARQDADKQREKSDQRQMDNIILLSEVKRLQTRNGDLEQQINYLHSQTQASSPGKTDAGIADAYKKIFDMRTQLSTQAQALEEKTTRIATLEVDLKDKTSEAETAQATLKQEIETSKNEHHEQMKEIQDLQNKNVESVKKIAALEQEVKESGERGNKLEKQLNEAQEALKTEDELTKESEVLKEEVAHLKKEKEESAAAHQKQSEADKAKIEQREKLNKGLWKQSNDEKESSSKKIESLEAKIKTLEDAIKKLKADREENEEKADIEEEDQEYIEEMENQLEDQSRLIESYEEQLKKYKEAEDQRAQKTADAVGSEFDDDILELAGANQESPSSTSDSESEDDSGSEDELPVNSDKKAGKQAVRDPPGSPASEPKVDQKKKPQSAKDEEWDGITIEIVAKPPNGRKMKPLPTNSILNHTKPKQDGTKTSSAPPAIDPEKANKASASAPSTANPEEVNTTAPSATSAPSQGNAIFDLGNIFGAQGTAQGKASKTVSAPSSATTAGAPSVTGTSFGMGFWDMVKKDGGVPNPFQWKPSQSEPKAATENQKDDVAMADAESAPATVASPPQPLPSPQVSGSSTGKASSEAPAPQSLPGLGNLPPAETAPPAEPQDEEMAEAPLTDYDSDNNSLMDHGADDLPTAPWDDSTVDAEAAAAANDIPPFSSSEPDVDQGSEVQYHPGTNIPILDPADLEPPDSPRPQPPPQPPPQPSAAPPREEKLEDEIDYGSD